MLDMSPSPASTDRPNHLPANAMFSAHRGHTTAAGSGTDLMHVIFGQLGVPIRSASFRIAVAITVLAILFVRSPAEVSNVAVLGIGVREVSGNHSFGARPHKGFQDEIVDKSINTRSIAISHMKSVISIVRFWPMESRVQFCPFRSQIVFSSGTSSESTPNRTVTAKPVAWICSNLAVFNTHDILLG